MAIDRAGALRRESIATDRVVTRADRVEDGRSGRRALVAPVIVIIGYAFLGFFGTNARNRRGLSTVMPRSTSSVAPAAFSLGTNTVSVLA